MDILKLASFGLAATILIVFMQEKNKAIGLIMRMLAAVLILLVMLPHLKIVFNVIFNLADKMSLQDQYINIVFKVIGIAYISEFAYQLCKDGGEEAIASKVQLAGKVMIMVLAAPIALALIELITQLL